MSTFLLRGSLILIAILATGCVARGQFNTGGGKDVRYDGERPYAVMLTQPTLCSEYPVEYRRYLPSAEGTTTSWELRLLANSRNPCAPAPGTKLRQFLDSVVEGVIK
jgi:hypothetical protein